MTDFTEFTDVEEVLVQHLRARRDEVGQATDAPELHEVLARGSSSTQQLVGSAAAAFTLVAAAVAVIVVGVLALNRGDLQRVDTGPATGADDGIPEGVPLLFPQPPATGVAAATLAEEMARLGNAASQAGQAARDTSVDGHTETYVAGAVDDTARFVALVSSNTPDQGTGLYGSMPEPGFDPGRWFDDPELESHQDGLESIALPGTDRAVAAPSGYGHTIAAISGDRRIALFGSGVQIDDLRHLAATVDWSGEFPSLTVAPPGFELLVPAADRAALFPAYQVTMAGANVVVSPLDSAAGLVATGLLHAAAKPEGLTVLRSGPDWVLGGPTEAHMVRGIRDGAWVTATRASEDDTALLTIFDGLRPVSRTDFGAALRRGDDALAEARRQGIDEAVERLVSQSGWVPVLARGERVTDLGQISWVPPFAGGLTGVTPLWNPATGATIQFADAVTDSSGPGRVRVGDLTIAGRSARLEELRGTPGLLFVAFNDGPGGSGGHSVEIVTEGLTLGEVRAIATTLIQTNTGRWALPTPPGFEPIPLASTIDAEESRKDSTPSGPNGTTLRIIDAADDRTDTASGVRVEISDLDPDVYRNVMGYFFANGPVERMDTGGVVWYRRRSDAGPERSVLLPGTDARPAIVASSTTRTDDELFEIVTTAAPVSDREIARMLSGGQAR